MSAYVLSELNFNKIVKSIGHFCGKDVTLLSPTELGQLLVDENYKSVNYRYSEHDEPFKFVLSPSTVRFNTPVELLKALDCLEYQSCEHPEYKTSDAKFMIERARSAAIRSLPGYSEAEWSS